MQPQDQPEAEAKAAKNPRFRIEKLEERIAPRKGGIRGAPDDHDTGGGRRCHVRGARSC